MGTVVSITFFFAGVAFVTFALSGMLFQKFWKTSGDSFFKHLRTAFWLLAFERLLGLGTFVLDPTDAGQAYTRPWLYLVRLVAFIVILFAVIQKNRSADLR